MVGVEAYISAAWLHGSADDIPPFNALFFQDVSADWISTFRARVGYAKDNWLFYATGGGAVANVTQTVSVPVVGISIAKTTDMLGWTAGGGVEWLVRPIFR